MLMPHPLMSDTLYKRVLDFNTGDTTISHDEIMVEYWDSVSEAVLTMCETYNLDPLYVIDEFCVSSDFPDDPYQHNNTIEPVF